MRLLRQLLWNSSLVGCAVITIGVAVLIGLALLLLSGAQNREQEHYDLNDGSGSGNNPIAGGEWVQFKGYRLRFPAIQYQATSDLLAMDTDNPTPPPGNQQILVQVEVVCEKVYCSGEYIAEQIEVYTEARMPHRESPVFQLDENLKQYEASNGEDFSGWLVFEISEDHAVRLIEITDFNERVSLYVFPPPG